MDVDGDFISKIYLLILQFPGYLIVAVIDNVYIITKSGNILRNDRLKLYSFF